MRVCLGVERWCRFYEMRCAQLPAAVTGSDACLRFNSSNCCLLMCARVCHSTDECLQRDAATMMVVRACTMRDGIIMQDTGTSILVSRGSRPGPWQDGVFHSYVIRYPMGPMPHAPCPITQLLLPRGVTVHLSRHTSCHYVSHHND